eukprot:48489-Karenia_brevis.AAC.1
MGDGPHTYRDVLKACGGGLGFKPQDLEELLDDANFIVHFGGADALGHAIAVKCEGSLAQVCDPCHPTTVLVPAES